MDRLLLERPVAQDAGPPAELRDERGRWAVGEFAVEARRGEFDPKWLRDAQGNWRGATPDDYHGETATQREKEGMYSALKDPVTGRVYAGAAHPLILHSLDPKIRDRRHALCPDSGLRPLDDQAALELSQSAHDVHN